VNVPDYFDRIERHLTEAVDRQAREPRRNRKLEDARTRWRGSSVVLATIAVAVVVAVAAVFISSVHSSHSPRTGAIGTSPGELCGVAGARRLSRRPPQSLLSILGVLRRPQTGQDRVGQQLWERPVPAPARRSGIRRGVGIGEVLTNNGLDPRTQVAHSVGFVYSDYVRRARVLNGVSYYLIPIVAGVDLKHPEGCVHPYVGLAFASNRPGHGGSGSCCSNTPQILAGRGGGVISGGSNEASTESLVVPDKVASATLEFSSPPNQGDLGGRSSASSTTATVTARPVGNVIVLTLPGGRYSERPKTTIWRSATGAVIKTFH
jgi:hypothetical protein